LGAQINPRKFKVLPWDIGVYQRLLGLDMSELLVADDTDLINKGALAELFVGLELIGTASPYAKAQLHYWHREARSSNAEVDYVLQKGAGIIPLEVKAGARGQMQSMRLFQSERQLNLGICIGFRNFGRQQDIRFVPIYATCRLRDML
jgi:predicted AAA+ superfamily ATPase